MSRALADDIAARLAAETPRVVYKYAVPANPAALYYLVTCTDTRSVDTLSDVARMRDAVVWVTSVSRNPDPVAAANEAEWGREKAADALMGWRTATGDIAWKPEHLDAQPLQRDTELPETVMFTVDRYGITYQ